MSVDQKLQDLHDQRMKALAEYGLLGLEEEYWMMRAEKASRMIAVLGDVTATNITKGQISICYETADEAKRTRKGIEEKAKSKVSEATFEKGLSVV